MSRQPVNLAREPFVNLRPIRRATVALWVVASLLAVVNVTLYWRGIFGLEDRRAQLADVQEGIDAERERIDDLRTRLRAMDLRQQNAEALFLNERIAERAFPWSRLFEDIARVLPRGVRLFSLRPQPERSRGAVVEEVREDRHPVALQASGAADSDESLLELLDNLFANEAFLDPNVPRETREKDGSIRFSVSVRYRPAELVLDDSSLAEPEELAATGDEERVEDEESEEVTADRGTIAESIGTGRAGETPPGEGRSGESGGSATEERAFRAPSEGFGERRRPPTDDRPAGGSPGTRATDRRSTGSSTAPSRPTGRGAPDVEDRGAVLLGPTASGPGVPRR